jgi:protoporphyrinogen oxidase
VICPFVLLKKAVSPYYVTNITDKGFPYTGVIEMTALIGNEQMNGRHLVYLPRYANPDDSMFDENDDKLKEVFLGALLKMHSHISKDDIVMWGVSKARNVFALPTVGYSIRLPGIATSIKNYYIINSAQIINGTLNVNETIQVAESKLNEILNV